MGVLIFLITLVTTISVRAITVQDNYPQFLVLPAQNRYGTQKEVEVNYNDLHVKELQTPGYYQFPKNENVGSSVNINPNFERNILFSNNKNNPQFINVKNSNDESIPPTIRSESGAKPLLFKPYMKNEQTEKSMPEICSPGENAENPDCFENLTKFPFNKVTYTSLPDSRPSSKNLQESDTDEPVEATQKPGSHIWQKYLNLPLTYTIPNYANKARTIYIDNLQTNGAEQSNTFEYFHSPSMKNLITKAHQLENYQGLNYMTDGIISNGDTKPQPSDKHEVYHETIPDDYQGNDEEYHSFHPEVKKKKKEIHYHQHKHLHEHDHEQKHKHNHQSGHHHGHGHKHQNQHAHSHSHMDDHWHNHFEKNQHHHESHHSHGHQGYHEHKHSGDHAHKHHNDHNHGHEAHHDHHEDHWNEHSHKHHSDHSHRHGHKHESKHSHYHKQNHGHKHHHKHSGKY